MNLVRALMAGLVFGAFLFLSNAEAVQQLFDSWRLYPVAKKPGCVFSVDIDGDGDLDLVVSHIQTDATGDNPVIILKNDGAGFFSKDTTLYTSGTPRQVVVRDLDVADGDKDILTVNPGTSRVTIFKNRGGDRGFELPIDCPVGRQPLSVIADLIDGDSTPDLLTANYSAGTASILINHGAAAFPAETTKFLGVGPRSAVIIDFDNDGDNDLAVSVSTEPLDRKIGINGIVVIENDTLPNGKSAFNDSNRVFFKIPMQTDTSKADTLYNPMQLVAADFNNDGYLDLALADSAVFNQPTRANVSIFMNQFPVQGGLNSRTFAAPAHYRVGIECRSIFTADLDNDDDIDIAAANAKDGTVSILKNNGNGTFPAKVDYLCPIVPYWVDGGDYDRDGDIDLALASNAGAGVAILRNKGNGIFEVGSEYTTGTFSVAQGVAAGDLDGDGDVDLAVANQGTNQITTHLNNGSGGFPLNPSGLVFTGGARALALVDLDADGDKDLAAANQNSRNVAIYKNNGNATFQSPVTYSIGNTIYSIVARDLENDGDFDLAVVSPTTNAESVYVLKNNGDGTFVPRVGFPTGKVSIFITSADFNGDGFNDLATVDQNFGPFFDSVSILFNDGTGAFLPRVSHVVGSSPTSMVAADFDGDGDADWAVTNSGDTERGDSSVMVFMNNGNGTFAPRVRYQAGAGPVAILAADMDGDGDLDIVTADSASNAAGFMANNGNGTFAPPVEYGSGPNPRGVAVADLDAEGDLDLAVTNQSTVASFPVYVNTKVGAFTVLKNLTNVPCFTRGDLNGDGVLSVVDLTLEMNCVFLSIGACPVCVADANCDTRFSAADLGLLLQAVFVGGGLNCP